MSLSLIPVKEEGQDARQEAQKNLIIKEANYILASTIPDAKSGEPDEKVQAEKTQRARRK